MKIPPKVTREDCQGHVRKIVSAAPFPSRPMGHESDSQVLMTTPTRISGTNLRRARPFVFLVAFLNMRATTRKARVLKAT